MGIDLVASTRDEFSNKTEASSGYFALTTVLSRGGEWGRQTTRRRWRGALVVETGFILRDGNYLKILILYSILGTYSIITQDKSHVTHMWFIHQTCKMSKNLYWYHKKLAKHCKSLAIDILWRSGKIHVTRVIALHGVTWTSCLLVTWGTLSYWNGEACSLIPLSNI